MRHSGRPLRLSAALLLAACGDTVGPAPPPVLRITSITPEYDAWEVETGATVAIVFNQAINPATITPETFQVRLDGGVKLVAALSYDATTRTARAVAPLLPGPTHEIVVTTGVRTPGGAPLAATRRSRFRTHAWQAVTVDTAENVGYLDMAVDATGRLHVSYSAIRPNRLKYATCAPGCDAAGSWHAVTMDTASGKNDLAVDAGGRVHIIYHDYGNYALKYATCAAGCDAASSWQVVAVDTAGLVGANPALAVDGGGRLHVLYDDFGDGYQSSIKYATCVAGCDAPGNWRVTVVTPGSGDKALAVDASGRLHVFYDEWPSPKYATCAIGCDAAANWQAVNVDDAGGGYVALAVDANGRRHLSYWDGYNYDLKYATCAAGCVAAGSWQVVPLDTFELVGPFTGLAVDASGRLHISYHDWGEEDLKYATCAAGCAAADSWQAITVAGEGNVGFGSALAVDANGRTHVIYRDMTYRILKYMH